MSQDNPVPMDDHPPGDQWVPDPRRPLQAMMKRWGVLPPSARYITPEDVLNIRVCSVPAGVTVTVRARILQPDGQVVPSSWALPASAARAVATLTEQLYEGFLLSLTVSASPAPNRRGSVFVEVSIFRGSGPTFEVGEVLVSDYVTSNQHLGYPGGFLRQSIEGPGNLQTLVSVAPGAGAEMTPIVVPVGARWRPIGMRVSLTTAVAVANRFPHFLVDDGANVFINTAPSAAQAASLTVGYDFSPQGFEIAPSDGEAYIPFPVGLVLLQGWRIRSLTTALQAADQYSASVLAYEEWFEE